MDAIRRGPVGSDDEWYDLGTPTSSFQSLAEHKGPSRPLTLEEQVQQLQKVVQEQQRLIDKMTQKDNVDKRWV